MAPKYKLTYFDITGLGECIRWMLSYKGEDFEDVRIPFDQWPVLKSQTPFGKMPVLEIDGKKITQSATICRYLAKQCGLAGDNDWEALQIDAINDTFTDLRLEISAIFYLPDETSKAKKKEQVINEALPYYLTKFDEVVKKNGGYFANGKLSWADIYIISTAEYFSKFLEHDLFGKYPNLKALELKIKQLPTIKAWIAKRPAAK